jgi:YegS/Rv2252/BmrU family lipid kinase
MTTVAVVAHTGKTTGGGLIELRRRLAEEGVTEPLWFEVAKSKRAPARVRKAVSAGADLVLVWGGDGMVQRCVDALAGSEAAMAVVPAGTANLFATNLGIPQHIGGAVRVAMRGSRTRLDVGRINGERFAVMAGVGVDALMIRAADAGLKDRIGQLAYVVTGASEIRADPFRARVKIDRTSWFDGDVTSVLVGNVGTVMGGIEAFEDARPDDGVLEIGVVTADGAVEWARTLARAAVGTAARSPFVQTVSGRRVRIKLDREMPYELDGGDRPATRSLKIDVEPGAVTVCVPPNSTFAHPAAETSSAAAIGETGGRS